MNESIWVLLTLQRLSFVKWQQLQWWRRHCLNSVSSDVSLKQSPAKLICPTFTYWVQWLWKAAFPKLFLQRGNDLLEASFYKVATWCFLLWPSPKKHQSSLALSTHWTYKHAFSLTELTATMNLNSEMHKRRVCFNSCFYNESLGVTTLKTAGSYRLSFHCLLFFLMPSCQGTPTKVFQNKGTKHKKAKRILIIGCKGILHGDSLRADIGFFSPIYNSLVKVNYA